MKTIVVVTAACFCVFSCAPPPPSIAEGEGEEGEGEEGEGEATDFTQAINDGCTHDVACGFVADFDDCVADEEKEIDKYDSCDGFSDAYFALVDCAAGSCAPDCTVPLDALTALITECSVAPVLDVAEEMCARTEACFGETPFCVESQTFDLPKAGPECDAAYDAFRAAAACLEDTSCEDTIDCDPFFAAYFDEVFLCDAGPPPPGAPFPEDRVYLHDLFPEQPDEECNPAEVGNCFQSFEACADGIANYVVTDILLPGLYAEDAGVVTLALQETGGETPELVTFTVEEDGSLTRDFDGAVFVRDPDGVAFCD